MDENTKIRFGSISEVDFLYILILLQTAYTYTSIRSNVGIPGSQANVRY